MLSGVICGYGVGVAVPGEPGMRRRADRNGLLLLGLHCSNRERGQGNDR